MPNYKIPICFFSFFYENVIAIRCISQNIPYVRMVNIESNMTIFGRCYNLLNNKLTCLCMPTITSPSSLNVPLDTFPIWLHVYDDLFNEV